MKTFILITLTLIAIAVAASFIATAIETRAATRDMRKRAALVACLSKTSTPRRKP